MPGFTANILAHRHVCVCVCVCVCVYLLALRDRKSYLLALRDGKSYLLALRDRKSYLLVLRRWRSYPFAETYELVPICRDKRNRTCQNVPGEGVLLQGAQVALQQFTLLQQVRGVLDLGLQGAGHLRSLMPVDSRTLQCTLSTQLHAAVYS